MSDFLKKEADVLRVFSPKESRRYFTSAILLAAGSGSRFGVEQGRKQFCPICSEPALVHTLRAFEKSEYIREVIIVTRSEDIQRCQEYCTEYGFQKVTAVVAGGSERQQSAKIGFEAVSPKSEYVALHDGARCLVTTEIIDSTVRAAYEYGAAVAAEKTRDTVKHATASGFIAETPDRSTIWLAKTPQVFLSNMYRAAVYTAEKDGFTATDDSMLVERLGFKVKLVDCGPENIKLTTPGDVRLAETILSMRAGN